MSDEKHRRVSIFSGPVKNKSGKITGRLWIYIDVTKMKEADELLHTVVNASPVPLIITRISDGEILFANEELGDLVGTAARDLIGKKSPDFYYNPDDRKIVLQKIREDGYLKNHEVRLKRADGSVFWAIFSLVATKIDGEKVMIGGILDIQTRKLMEDAIRWERNFVSAVLDTAGALVVVLDTDGSIVQFNKACQETTGYSFKEVSGKKVWDLFIPSEEIKGIKEIFNNIKAGMFPNAHENCWLTKDGNKRLISWSNTALSDDEGQVEHVIATGIDITERKEAEEKLKLYKEIFMNTSDGITIINPNGKIIDRNPAHREYSGLTDEELYGKTPGEFMCGDSLKSVDAGASRVNKIVKRLRSFARLDEAELKKVDIHKGIEDTLALIHHEIKHKAEIIKTFGDIPAIACFPGQLNQVFLNLLVNSTQAIADKGEITITTERVDNKIKITFEDTGAGISPENLRRIFDPGFTTKGVGVGTGLGLSICYQIIQDHHGEIMAESEPGKGTKFTIILPTNLDEIINSRIE